jgi:hypothetical protein
MKKGQTWVSLVNATGQGLAFHKSFWSVLAWRKLGGYFIPKPRQEFVDIDIYVKDHKGKSSKIGYKHIDEPNEGLGLNMCMMNADQMFEFRKREKQSITYASRISTAKLQLHEAWTGLTVNIIPSITYHSP